MLEQKFDNQNSFRNFLLNVRRAWNWVWNSDSILSWIVAMILIYAFIKLIFFPGLSLIFGTALPIAGVESSSMDHQMIKVSDDQYYLCGKFFSKSEKERINFEEYWGRCGSWYSSRNISKEEFSEFSMSNGFKKGDVVIVWGRFTPKVGDIIIFQQKSSTAPNPIIHRIVKIENGILQTKGDHNGEQLTASNNPYRTDETNISEDEIVGKAILKVPYLGYPKIWLTDFVKFVL
jgi:signal peptidase I